MKFSGTRQKREKFNRQVCPGSREGEKERNRKHSRTAKQTGHEIKKFKKEKKKQQQNNRSREIYEVAQDFEILIIHKLYFSESQNG